MPKLKDEIVALINANSAPYVKNFHYSGRFITDDDIERIAATISASKENEGKQAGVSGEQIWKLACNELLANIAWTFANPDNTAKADNNYDKVVFEALGETIQNFPVPIYPGDELPTIDSLRVKEAGERMKLIGEVEELKKINKDYEEECDRLAGIIKFWQSEYHKLNPTPQPGKIDNL